MQSIASIAKLMAEYTSNYEVLIIDDASDDNTGRLDWTELQQSYNAVYLRHPDRRGKGAAIKSGLEAARGRYVFITDADLPIATSSMRRLISLLMHNRADLIIGNRRAKDSTVNGESLARRIVASKIFNFAVQAIILPGYQDTQCCLKGLSPNALDLLRTRLLSQGFSVDVEIIYLCKRKRLQIQQIPVQWEDLRAATPIGRLSWIVISAIFEVIVIRIRHITS